MVNKLAVAALVLIIATPILLGYAMNVETTTETTYKADKQSIDVTMLLKDSENYQYITSDPYTMNAMIFSDYKFPVYQSFTSTSTSLYMKQFVYKSGDTPAPFDPRDTEWYHFEYNANDMNIVITGTGGNLVPINSVTDVYYTKDGDNLKVTYNNGQTHTYHGVIYVSYNAVSSGIAVVHYALTAWDSYTKVSNANAYINLIGGYKFNNDISYNLPSLSNMIVMSLDLYTGENGAFGLTFGSPAQLGINFTKYVDHWDIRVNNGSGPLTKIFELPIYNADNSVYQMTITNNQLRFDYVSKWYLPSFGVANSYATWTYDINIDDFQAITYHPENATTISPTLRLDVAMVRSLTYTTIEDATFDPTTIKPTNPATTVSKISRYGSSITFGGHTYTVSDKSITVGTHQIPIDGLVFNSIPNGGNYDNRIGETVISTTATPSDITFNGKWLATIDVDSQSATTRNVTNWIAGGFAFDGIDQDFLFIGLAACLATFVGLGLYAHRTGKNTLPLMVVCIGTGFLFLILI